MLSRSLDSNEDGFNGLPKFLIGTSLGGCISADLCRQTVRILLPSDEKRLVLQSLLLYLGIMNKVRRSLTEEAMNVPVVTIPPNVISLAAYASQGEHKSFGFG